MKEIQKTRISSLYDHYTGTEIVKFYNDGSYTIAKDLDFPNFLRRIFDIFCQTGIARNISGIQLTMELITFAQFLVSYYNTNEKFRLAIEEDFMLSDTFQRINIIVNGYDE